ncbi:MAG: hypothetical protein HY901_29265 [Deltaproteobacteria bacterium]|nr:hypothetical protein [Deltaproteobacteria bacterium]
MKALLIGIVALQCGCGTLLAVQEPLRIGNWADLDERQLSLVRGRTTLQQAEQAMHRLGLTGVRSDTYVGDGSRMVSALSADFQTRVHLFENDRYQRSLAVGSGGELPFGYALRVARSGDGLILVALYRDPRLVTDASASANGPRLGLFVEGEGGFELAKTLPLDALASAHQGLTSPLFVGHDFGEGVIFLARDREGRLWEHAYLMTLKRGELALQPLSLDEAARCSCVERYVYAASAEELGRE